MEVILPQSCSNMYMTLTTPIRGNPSHVCCTTTGMIGASGSHHSLTHSTWTTGGIGSMEMIKVLPMMTRPGESLQEPGVLHYDYIVYSRCVCTAS